MPRPNLLKIDDVMLKAGVWAALAWLLGSLIAVVIALDAAEGLAHTAGFILAFASAPIGLWIAGFRLRQREKRAWALHRLIDDHEAGNGQVALEKVAEQAPSLILLDLMMPVMDGFEFVLEIRKLESSRAIPIVVVAATEESGT